MFFSFNNVVSRSVVFDLIAKANFTLGSQVYVCTARGIIWKLISSTKSYLRIMFQRTYFTVLILTNDISKTYNVFI